MTSFPALALSAWSFAAAALAYAALGAYLLRAGGWRDAGHAPARLLLGAAILWAAWGAFGLADHFAGTVVFQRLGAFADVLAYGCWFAFLLRLLQPRAIGAGGWGLWIAASLLVGANLLLQGLVAAGAGGFEEASRLVVIGWLVLPVLGLVLLEQLLRSLQDDSLWNAKPLALGLGATFAFDLFLFSQAAMFGSLDVDAAAVRGLVRALMVPLLLRSASRRRDWAASLRVSRQAAFHSVALLLAGGYLVFVSAVGYYVRYFGGDWGRALQLGLVFVAVVGLAVLALSGSVRARLRVWLGKNFFRYRYDYRDEWLRFTRALSAQTSPLEMGLQVVRGLAGMVESPAGVLWLKAAGQDGLREAARWNLPACGETEPADASLGRFLAATGWVVNLDEYRAAPRRYDGLELPAWLAAMPRAWLVVPLRAGDELIGFVVLAGARTAVEVNWEVNDLLKTAAQQAAGFLAQMQATEALLEARKFEAFNRMSAFVVHDLKNIVTQLSLMLKNAKRLHDNPEFQADMLLTIENSLDKMRQLMLQLREGAASPGAAAGVDLAALLQRVAAAAAGRGREVELRVHEPVFARADAQRLERVVGHMVHNALDATEAGGRVWVELGRRSGLASVEVGDTGQGMTPEFVRERLAKPFQTTKQAGMGIGAFESFQYVRELGGSVEVDSTPGAGTRITLLLPMLDQRAGSDLQMLQAS